MKKTLMRTIIAVVLILAIGFCFVACKKGEGEANASTTTSEAESTAAGTTPKKIDNETTPGAAPQPGESGFTEIEISEVPVIVGPFQIAMVYFQGVDMIPEGKQPSAAESDMHLEADIALTEEASSKYGFGGGEGVWPAYLTVDFKIMSEDGSTEITSGSMMPMNADDGAHYGLNIGKDKIAVGKYKIILEVQPSGDYLLHVDSDTGVPIATAEGVEAAQKYYEKVTAEFDWNYTGEQLSNE